MTTGAHIALRDAVVALLEAAPALAGGRIESRRKRQPMPQNVAEEIRVWLHTSDGKRADTANTKYEWTTVIAVHCLARDSSGIDAETRVDAMAQAVTSRVLNSARLGGLALDIRLDRITWEGEEMDSSTADAVLAFSIFHRTQIGIS